MPEKYNAVYKKKFTSMNNSS
ncbi:hypothetical protein ACVNPX_00205 [Staphylococcus aureus]